jgi:hypothetical protein
MIFSSRFSTILRNLKLQIEFVFSFNKFYIKKLKAQRFLLICSKIEEMGLFLVKNFYT